MEAEDIAGDPGPFGSRLVGVGFGLVVFAGLVMLPFLVPVTFYVLANIYAVIKGTTFSSQTANTGVVLTLLVFSVALWPVGLAVLIAGVGPATLPTAELAMGLSSPGFWLVIAGVLLFAWTAMLPSPA